jgi:hypothetical protein
MTKRIMSYVLVTIISLATVVLVGCGSSTPAPESNANELNTDPRAELYQAVVNYSDAFLAGQGSTAYGMLSVRCQQRVAQPEFVGASQLAQSVYGQQSISTLNIDEVSGNLARVSYTYPNSSINQLSEPWVYENSSWKQDDC